MTTHNRDRLLAYDQALELFHKAGLTDLNLKWLKNRCDNGKVSAVVVKRKRRFKESHIRQMIADMFADVG